MNINKGPMSHFRVVLYSVFVREMEIVSKWGFVKNVVSFAAVFRDVTQRALRDILTIDYLND